MARVILRPQYHDMKNFVPFEQDPGAKKIHGAGGVIKKGSLLGRNIRLKNINFNYQDNKKCSLNRGSLIDFLNKNIERSTLTPAEQKKLKLSKGFVGLGGSSNKKVKAAMDQYSEIFAKRKPA